MEGRMPIPSEMVFCEVCQNEVVTCKHLRREAHLKECRDVAWLKFMSRQPKKPHPFDWLNGGTENWVSCGCGIRHEPPKCDSRFFDDEYLQAEFDKL
jgi:hypothetical protein